MDELRFSSKERSPTSGRIAALAVLLVLVVGGYSVGRILEPQMVEPPPLVEVVVEVRGDVPEPGFYAIEAPLRAHGALQAAGVSNLEGIPDAVLEPGTRLVLEGRRYHLESVDRPLVIGLPVDLNRASREALESIPGIGATLAGAIIESRDQKGAFHTIEELERVKGIGPATLEKVRPFVSAGDPPQQK